MILVIDNYDSFVHNLARYIRQLGFETTVVRNDSIDLETIRIMQPSAIVISPGPCSPCQAGCSLDVVSTFADTIPMLGVCLGHQVIVQALGGEIIRSHQPMHGRPSEIRHSGSPLFEKVPDTFLAGRYHSLVAETRTLPPCLKVTSRTEDGTIMSVEHQTRPIVGLQFHPESILTEHGHRLLANFFNTSGCLAESPDRVDLCDQLMQDETSAARQSS